MPHVLDDGEALMAARLIALYPALYNAVADLHGMPELQPDEREAIERLADRLSTPGRPA
jgi:metal-dependent amidase/aminoacylase/carboxypeptidase family protein